MKFFDFLKMNKIWILSYAVIMMIINSGIIGSSKITILADDLIYINVLTLFIEGIAILAKYVTDKAYYDNGLKSLRLNNKLGNSENYFLRNIDELMQEKDNVIEQIHTEYEKSMIEIQEYITRWVHDIKVDIAVCKLLLEESEEEQFNLLSQVEQINFKVNQILQIARAQYYSNDCIVEKFNITDEVKEAIKANELFFIAKNISIIKNIEMNWVVSDRKWVRYILCQIINNCSKYSEVGGKVEIWSHKDKKAYYLHIKDYGVGISKSEINRIFDKGFTGNNGHRRNESSGMGLYYSKQIADRLNINLTVLSEEKVFTEFTLTFYKVSDYHKMVE